VGTCPGRPVTRQWRITMRLQNQYGRSESGRTMSSLCKTDLKIIFYVFDASGSPCQFPDALEIPQALDSALSVTSPSWTDTVLSWNLEAERRLSAASMSA